MEVRRQIEVSGIVQGVGFRPYVYRLATGRRLRGTIRNTSAGVTIEIQGPAETVQDFVERLPAEAPPLARITSVAVHDLPSNGDQDFCIVHNHEVEEVRTLISPDVAICPDCLRELFDPNDRRYRYPFINCTNCGPRFTIVRDVPYDRPFTTMAPFAMCPPCEAEYHDPAAPPPPPRNHRENKPFAVLVADLAQARDLVEVDEAAAGLLSSPARPI